MVLVGLMLSGSFLGKNLFINELRSIDDLVCFVCCVSSDYCVYRRFWVILEA
jgi:hypothetical protein